MMKAIAMSQTSPLTELQYQQFLRDGFIKVPRLASADLCRRMKNVVEESFEPSLGPLEYEVDVHYPGAPKDRRAEGGNTPRRLLHAYARDAVFREWACACNVVQIVKQLINVDKVLLTQNHHNCVMTKMPSFSSETGWHQDIRYWSFDRPELLNVWLALGREYDSNGGMKTIPGSHTSDIDCSRLDVDLFLRQDLVENNSLLETAVNVDLYEGDVLFFHCRTFHAAGANETEKPKYSTVFSYHAADNLPVPGTRSARLDSIDVESRT